MEILDYFVNEINLLPANFLALSLHCYECASFTDGPCSSPNQNHVAECSLQKLMSPLDSSSTFLERTFKSVGSFPRSGKFFKEFI